MFERSRGGCRLSGGPQAASKFQTKLNLACWHSRKKLLPQLGFLKHQCQLASLLYLTDDQTLLPSHTGHTGNSGSTACLHSEWTSLPVKPLAFVNRLNLTAALTASMPHYVASTRWPETLTEKYFFSVHVGLIGLSPVCFQDPGIQSDITESRAPSRPFFNSFQSLLCVHDAVAQRDFEPVLPPVPDDALEDEEESVKIVSLVKTKEPLVSTLYSEVLFKNKQHGETRYVNFLT